MPPHEPDACHAPSRLKLVVAYGCIYIIWGSTYLAIRWGIESIPPLLMAGSRFVLAAILLTAITLPGRYRAARAAMRLPRLPSGRMWGAALLLGTLMLAFGNGTVTWAEQYVPSAIIALLVGMVPMWMAVLGAIGPRGVRPTLKTLAGLLIGIAGVVILIGPSRITEAIGSFGDSGEAANGSRMLLWATVAMFFSTLAWSIGSLLSLRLVRPADKNTGTSMQMLLGGLVLLAAAAVRGEFVAFDPGAVTLRSALSFGYLVVFGSIIAFTAYTWLLTVSTPARVATYAYVNPVVAVALGAWLADEPLTRQTGLASAVIVAGVALVVSPKPAQPSPTPQCTSDAET
ncbi:MAG: EamA family transporter [Phycisphaerales bacterium]|nr:EamA family transporter [Phycisphaerales bacterium]